MITITIPLAMLIEAAAAIEAIYKGNSSEPLGYPKWDACVSAHCNFGFRVKRMIALSQPVEVTTPDIDALQTAAFAEGFDQAIEQGEAVAS